MTDGSTGKRHGDPEDKWVDSCHESRYPEHYCVESIFVDAEGEEATVEEENADFDGCDGEGVYEGLGVDDLRLVSTGPRVYWAGIRRTLKTSTRVVSFIDQT